MSNTKGYREQERKFRFVGSKHKLNKLIAYLISKTNTKDYLFAETKDQYWNVPGKGDFLRLRNSWGHTADGKAHRLKEITVKQKDKGSNFNRREVNCEVKSVQDCKELLKTTLGNQCLTLYKKEHVFWVSKRAVVISVSQIKNSWFFEVESNSSFLRNMWVEDCKSRMKDSLVAEPRSLYEIYLKR